MSATATTTCYACGEDFDAPDFYWLVVNDEGNVFNAEDVADDEHEEADEWIEVERCPRCGAEL